MNSMIAYVWIAIGFAVTFPPVTASPDCFDFLMTDVCISYYNFGQCHLYQAQRDCRKTCKVCGDGWATWSSWSRCSAECRGTQSRTRNCLSSPLYCPGDGFETQKCDRRGARCDGQTNDDDDDKENDKKEDGNLLPGPLIDYVCDDWTFRCTKDSVVCISNSFICDGYEDCPNGFDEDWSSCPLAVFSNSSFQIKNELMQTCFEVITGDPLGPILGVRAYRRCPNKYNSQRLKFNWRWWKAHHLLNLAKGMCLTADAPTKATEAKFRVERCNFAMPSQQWSCDNASDTTLLLRLREMVKGGEARFVNLGVNASGWPLVFSANVTEMKSMWQKGPKEPPESICKDLQVHWSYWGSWSDCSLTCKGGQRSRRKYCINGPAGIPPCEGPSVETSACNTMVLCEKQIGIELNSRCRFDFSQMDNEQRQTAKYVVDAQCFMVFGLSNGGLTYEDALLDCKNRRSSLASVKTKATQDFVLQLMKNHSSSTRMLGHGRTLSLNLFRSGTVPDLKPVYIGIAEDFSALIVQGHQFRFDFDHTSVGSFTPWENDCIIGPGYDYRGNRDKAFSAKTRQILRCQRWDSDTPHKVKHTPLTDSASNYCRNPNLDPSGPWCYTLDPDVPTAFCNIPQCAEFLTPIKLNEEYFQIVRELGGLITNSGVLGKNSIEIAKGKKKQCITAGGAKTFGQPGKPSTIWLRLKDCVKISYSGYIAEEQRFVWDISRKRILHEDSMLCIAASSGTSESPVQLEKCSADKLTQSWREEDSMIFMDYLENDEDLHLDVKNDRGELSVSSMELRAWTAVIAAGHMTDWLGLRRAFEDEAFELYNFDSKTCLALHVDNDVGNSATLNVGLSGVLTMLPCAGTAQFQWMRFPAAPNLILHIQTSLCLEADDMHINSKVSLKRCEVMRRVQWWTCSGFLYQQIVMQSDQDLALGIVKGSLRLQSSSNGGALWKAWGSKNRTACRFRVASGEELVGSLFVIKNQRLQKCLVHDKMGTIIMQDCKVQGNRSDELWSFTKAPSMIRQIESGKCLRAQSGKPGAPVGAYRCRTQDALQHWTLFAITTVKHHGVTFSYYSLHLVANPVLAVSLNGKTLNLQLREPVVFWTALGKNRRTTSLTMKTDCAVHIGNKIYYGGKTKITSNGHSCLLWSETRFGLIFPDLELNYCRNPGRITMEPWCFIENQDGIVMKENCQIPACIPVKVKMNSKGNWQPSTGSEKLPYICQAEPECYRGIGTDYIGSWNITSKGYCAFWEDHKKAAFEKNFCRNPNGDKDGPWCYTSKLKTSKWKCHLPKCQRTCINIPVPERLYQGDLVQLKYAASVYGAESGTDAVKRCHKGYWVSSGLFTTTTTCSYGAWIPELEPCEVVTCRGYSGVVAGAVLVASSSSVYDEFLYFTCHAGLLAAPTKAKVTFRCNEFGDWESTDGTDINNLQCTPACDTGWTQFREYCYKTFDKQSTFAGTDKYCSGFGGQMVDLDDKIAFDFLKSLILKAGGPNKHTTYFLGIKDYWHAGNSQVITKRQFKSINYANKGPFFEKRGVGYLPMLIVAFKIMQVEYARTNQKFQHWLPYKERCMFGYDHTDYVVSRGCEDYMRRRMLWTWISPFHLYHIGTRKCLTGSPSNGLGKLTQPTAATLQQCERDNKNQYITCRRHGAASLKLMFNEDSVFVDDVKSQLWDKVVMGNRDFGRTLSHWIIDDSELDVCHWSLTRKGNVFLLWEGKQAEGKSYSYDEAKKKCSKHGARLAKLSEIRKKGQTEDIASCFCAWTKGSGQQRYHRQESHGCASSASPGSHPCGVTPKADVFCSTGNDVFALDIPYALIILLKNATWQGVQERSTEEAHKMICRKEARWHCPPPPLIPRADLIEDTTTSYAYLGSTGYSCHLGFWFASGVFYQDIACTDKLKWDPDPATVSCEPLHCSEPPEIANANMTIHSLDLHGITEYDCEYGYQFTWREFSRQVTCGGRANWEPNPTNFLCYAIWCELLPSIEFATLVSFSKQYKYNATYTCIDGYWFGLNTPQLDVTCDADGLWKPDPHKLTCWEVVCPAFKQKPNMIFVRVNKKTIEIRCDKGYFLLFPQNDMLAPKNGTIICRGDGRWFSDPEVYSCKAFECGRPIELKDIPNSADNKLASFRSGTEIEYHCGVGGVLLRTFTLYNPFRKICLVRGKNNSVLTSTSTCGTLSALKTRWLDNTMLQDVNSSLCLAAEAVPTKLDSLQAVVLKECNSTDTSQQWHCSDFGSSTLRLGLSSTVHSFLTLKESSHYDYSYLHSTESYWLEWIDLLDRDAFPETHVCSYRIPQTSQKVKCVDEGLWDPDPVKAIKCEAVSCSLPPKMPSVTYEVLLLHFASSNVPYATSVKYTCEEGYEYLNDRTVFITRCSMLGNWVPDPKTLPCLPVRCLPKYMPPIKGIVTKGSPTYDYFYKDEIHVKCPNGWMLKPGVLNLTATCTSRGEWHVSSPIQACTAFSCDPPLDVRHATVTTTSQKLPLNTIARYTCKKGYWFAPGLNWKDTFCSKSAFWEPSPENFLCIVATCSEPSTVRFTERDDIMAMEKNGRYSFGSLIYIKCFHGWQFFEGMRKIAITCRDDYHWHPDPFFFKCIEMGCSHPQLAVHAYIIGKDFAIGSTVTIHCEEGYMLRVVAGKDNLDSVEIECLDTTLWSPSPLAYICRPISCEKPPDIENSHKLKSSRHLATFTQYECNIGFWIHPGMHYFLSECTVDKTWQPDPTTYTCKVVDCGHPGVFKNGKTQTDWTEYGAIAVLSCIDGFWLAGLFEANVELNCTDSGVWDPLPETLHCVAVKCEDPGLLPRARREVVDILPNSVHDSYDQLGNKYFVYNTRLTYSCDHGLQFSWQRKFFTTTCNGDGSWSINVGSMICSKIMCEFTSGILYGRVISNVATSSVDYIENTTLTIECEKGYWFSRGVYTKEVRCMENSNWDADLNKLACLRVTCESPANVDNATFIKTGLAASDKITFICEQGYEFFMHRQSHTYEVICSEDGKWLPDPAVLNCEIVECYAPINGIPNVDMSSFQGSGVMYGTVLNITCTNHHYFFPGVSTAKATCSEEGKWLEESTLSGCVEAESFHCTTTPRIPYAKPKQWKDNNITFECWPGYQYNVPSSGRSFRTITFKCNGGRWYPDPSIRPWCEEATCGALPNLKNGYYVGVSSAVLKLKSHAYATTLNVSCSIDHFILPNNFFRIRPLQRTYTTTCSENGTFFPPPSAIVCEVAMCSTPQLIQHATMSLRLSPGRVQSATFKCKDPRSFSRSSTFLVTACVGRDKYSPDPTGHRCQYFKCHMPPAKPHVTVALQANANVDAPQVMRIKCTYGYVIKIGSKRHLSLAIRCMATGSWELDIDRLNCESVKCLDPPDIPGTVTSSKPANAIVLRNQSFTHPLKTKLLYTCQDDKWFADIRSPTRSIQCKFDATWEPEANTLKCIEKSCLPHPDVQNMVTIGSNLSVGSVWAYRCKGNYLHKEKITGKNVTCKRNGEWSPNPSDLPSICSGDLCEMPPQIYNLDTHTINEYSSSRTFFHGQTYTYKCERGYWITKELKRRKSQTITCRYGKWDPPPEKISGCSIVVCDIPPVIETARLDGLNHYFGDFVSYQCATGQHFFHYRSRKVQVKCNEDGFWYPDPYALKCTDVICEEVNSVSVIQHGDRAHMHADVHLKCPSSTWFGRGKTEILARCDENGRWIPDVNQFSCKLISCGYPGLKNSLIREKNFSYSSSVTLHCLPGYSMVPPELVPPETICDMNGNWYPDPAFYRCEPVRCSDPPFLFRATFSGEPTFNSSIRVTCDPGFFFRNAMNYKDVFCDENAMWSDDFTSLNCKPVYCGNALTISHSTASMIGTISSPNYGARLRYTCHDKYWFGDRKYINVRCNESGLWDPDLSDITCILIACKRPPVKKNVLRINPPGVKNKSVSDVGTTLGFRCLPSYWLSTQYAFMEWSFVGMTAISIVCSKSGQWKPSPHSFACKNISDGPLPVAIEGGLSHAEVLHADWIKRANLSSVDVINHPHLKALSFGNSFWMDGASAVKKRGSIIQSSDRLDSGIELLWDGDLETHWIPKRRVRETHQFVIYLGDLVLVEGFEILSVARGAQSSVVVSLQISFLSNMRTFGDAKSCYLSTSRSVRNFPNDTGVMKDDVPLYLEESKARKTTVVRTAKPAVPIKCEGFSIPARFLKVAIKATLNPELPPIIQEIKLLVSPAQWAIVYPTDYFTIPSIVLALYVSGIVVYFVGSHWDKSDMNAVHVKWNNEGDTHQKQSNYCIKIKFSRLNKVGRIICRIRGEVRNTSFISIKPVCQRFLPSKHIVLFISGKDVASGRTNLDFGFLSNADGGNAVVGDSENEKQILSLKIALVKPSEPLFGRLNWFKATKKFWLLPGEPASLSLTTAAKKSESLISVQPRSKNFFICLIYNIMIHHTLLSVFMTDFLTQVTRTDKSVAVLLSCFVSTLASALLLQFNIMVDTLTCAGVGIVCSLPGLLSLYLLKHIFSASPVFAPLEYDAVNKAKKKKKKGRRLRRFGLSRGDSDTTSIGDTDEKLKELVRKFQDKDAQGRPFASMSVVSGDKKSLLASDSLFLPRQFAKNFMKLSDEKTVLEQLKEAARIRLQRPLRRVKSCYAVLQYFTEASVSPLPASEPAESLVSCPVLPDIDVMSCASMWSRSTVGRAWHDLHRSINTPVKKLFFARSEPQLWSDFASRSRQWHTEEKSGGCFLKHKEKSKQKKKSELQDCPPRFGSDKIWRFASFKDGKCRSFALTDESNFGLALDDKASFKDGILLSSALGDVPESNQNQALKDTVSFKDGEYGSYASKDEPESTLGLAWKEEASVSLDLQDSEMDTEETSQCWPKNIVFGKVNFNRDRLHRTEENHLTDEGHHQRVSVPTSRTPKEYGHILPPSAGGAFSTEKEKPDKTFSHASNSSEGHILTCLQKPPSQKPSAISKEPIFITFGKEVVASKTGKEFYRVTAKRTNVTSLAQLLSVACALGTAYSGVVPSNVVPTVICAHATALGAYFALILPLEALITYLVRKNIGRLSLKTVFLPHCPGCSDIESNPSIAVKQ